MAENTVITAWGGTCRADGILWVSTKDHGEIKMVFSDRDTMWKFYSKAFRMEVIADESPDSESGG